MNGYKTWAQWNVSLWINNDEGLYNLARDCIRHAKTRNDAARAMMDTLNDCGITKTPDGARYSVTGILASMRGM